jgi:predicted dehydrogenase
MRKRIRWGILGLGNIAHKFALGLQVLPEAELYAVGSRSQQKADAFAYTYNVPRAFGSYSELASCDEVDVIYISTPHSHHFDNTLMCLENKKAVLCEKPLAVNSSQVEKLIAVAQQNNVFLMEALWTRFLPKIEKTFELIYEGRIGNIQHVSADFGFCAPYDPGKRLFNPELAGGSLLDIGIYTIFFAYLFLGMPETINSTVSIGKTGIDEQCAMTFSYKNGEIAQLFSSIIAETQLTANICGDKGHITIEKPLFAPSNIFVSDISGNKEYYKIPSLGNGYNYEAQEVMDCFKQGKIQSDVYTWEDSKNIMKIMDTIRSQHHLTYPFEK